jgi:hypothetical protein
MALNATIDLTVKKPDFKSMKAEIRELTVAAQQAVMQFGEFSPEALKAEKALAGARDRMDDFNDRVKAVNPDRFSKINTVVQGVASGFAAAQGAMALFGNESKDFEKTMIKLQGAMALSQGLEGLGKIQQQFGAIFKDVVSGAKKAFAAIKAGIGSTGIGLILVALGAIVAYWDEIKEAVSGVDSEQKKLLADSKAQEKVEQDKLDTLNGQDSILKLQGLTEEEILKLKIQQTSAVITQLEAQLSAQETMKQAQMDAAQRNQDILKGVIEFLTFPLTMLLTTIDNVGKALGQDFGLQDAFSGTLAKMVFDPKSVEKEANVAIAETKKQLNTLKNTNAGYQLSINAIHTKAAEDKKKINDDAAQKELDDAAKLAEGKKKITNDTLAAEASARDAARQKELALLTDEGERIDKEYTNKLAALEEAKAAELKAIGDNAKAKAAIERKYDDLKIVALTELDAAELKLAEETAAKNKDLLEKETADKADAAAKALAADEAMKQSKQDLFDASMALANAVMGLVGEQSKAGKVLALGTIAADTAMSISNAMATTSSPASPDNLATGGIAGVAKYIALAAMILNNAKRAKDILKGGQPSAASGGGQMSGGGIPQMSAPNISSSLPTVGQFDTKVFVTEGDIRRTTDRVDTTRKVSVVK